MKHVLCAVLLLTSVAKSSSTKSIPTVDALIRRLEVEEWVDDEACRQASLRILHGVTNNTLWATWIWDSMQPPTGIFYGTGLSLGNYDQCLNTPWSTQHEVSTQYCLVEVKIQEPMEHRALGPYDKADEYLNTLSRFGRTFNHFGVGVCMPAVCSPSSVARFYRHVLKLTHIPDAELVAVDPKDCQTAEQKPYPKKLYAFLFALGVLSSIVTASTIYSYKNNNKGNSIIDEIAKSFCMIHNWNDMFKVNKNEIRVIHGIRFLTAIMVVGCHQYFFLICLPSFLVNSIDVDKLSETKLGHLFAHIDLIVDTFFVISGLLLMKGLMSGRQRNLVIVLLKRYLRLIGPYAAITFYVLCVARHTGSGPFWLRTVADEEGTCEKYWWKNFFMMNYDVRTTCFGVAWYVTCDYHLAILSVVLFWIYRRRRKAGIMSFLAVGCILAVQLAIKVYSRRLPVVPFSYIQTVSWWMKVPRDRQEASIFEGFSLFPENPIVDNLAGNVQHYEVMNDVYIRWHDRASAYLVGVAMGWLMAVYKPAEYRKTFNKKTSCIIVVVSLLAMIRMATLSHWFRDAGRVEVALAVATNRAVWATAICALIGVCEYGSVPVISDFLGSAVFVPLSKLSYGIYMTHFLLVQRNMHAVRTLVTFDIFNMIILVIGTTALTSVVSLVLYILVEAPCINLSNLNLTERKVKEEPNTNIYKNGKTKIV